MVPKAEMKEPESLVQALNNGYWLLFGQQWPIWLGGIPVSYTHLPLPTNREV